MPRGRLRKFDEDQALNGAMYLFWKKGLSATSLDDLAEAMNMNRPSIYNAFGNKEQIYRMSLTRFCSQLDEAIEGILEAEPRVNRGIVAFFDQAIEVYCGADLPLGCFMVCTAPSEAFSNREIATDLKNLIQRLDQGFEHRLQRALEEGELSSSVEPKMAAKLLQATLQSIALRARSGATKKSLKGLSRYAVRIILNQTVSQVR